MEKSKKLLGLLTTGAIVLAVGGSVALVASEEPAEAAFPGQNGLIAFVTEREGMMGPGIWTVRQDGKGQAGLAGGMAGSPQWSPDGKKIAYFDNITDLELRGGVYVTSTSVAPKTTVAVADGPDFYESSPAWYPSGRRIAYAAAPLERDENGDPRVTGDSEIYSVPVDLSGRPTGQPAQLTDNDTSEYPTSVSPDGQRLAFTGYRDGDAEVYVMGANRRESPANVPVKLTDNGARDGDADFSPDGARLAYDSYDAAGGYHVWTMDAADGSGKKNLTRNPKTPGVTGGRSPSWSPTGKKIAFDRTGDENAGIWKMWADGSHEVRVTDGTKAEFIPDHSPSWQPLTR